MVVKQIWKNMHHLHSTYPKVNNYFSKALHVCFVNWEAPEIQTIVFNWRGGDRVSLCCCQYCNIIFLLWQGKLASSCVPLTSPYPRHVNWAMKDSIRESISWLHTPQGNPGETSVSTRIFQNQIWGHLSSLGSWNILSVPMSKLWKLF